MITFVLLFVLSISTELFNVWAGCWFECPAYFQWFRTLVWQRLYQEFSHHHVLISFLQHWATNKLLDCIVLGSSTSGSSQVSFSKLAIGLEWELVSRKLRNREISNIARFRPWLCDSEAEDSWQTLLISEEISAPQLRSWNWCERRNIMEKQNVKTLRYWGGIWYLKVHLCWIQWVLLHFPVPLESLLNAPLKQLLCHLTEGHHPVTARHKQHQH